jgi:hypothetical protein
MTTYTIHKHGSGWRVENAKGQVIQPFLTRKGAEEFRQMMESAKTEAGK